MFRMFLRYWWLVIKTALRGSVVFLGFSHPSRFAIALALFIAAVVILQAIGGQTQMEDEIRWGIATLIAVAVFFIPTFIVNLLYTPVKIDRAKQDNIKRMEGITASYKANRDVSDGLVDLYQILSFLIAEKITSAEQLKDWERRKQEWWGSATTFMRQKISLSESVLFSSVSVETPSNVDTTFQNEYNREHHDGLTVLNQLSQRLEELMIKYDKAIDSGD